MHEQDEPRKGDELNKQPRDPGTHGHGHERPMDDPGRGHGDPMDDLLPDAGTDGTPAR